MARKSAPWFKVGSGPPSESYGRVTNSERYAVLHDEANSIIESLVSTYEVMAETGDVAIDFPEWKGSAGDVTRLVPTQGTPMAFLFTDFPGVVIRLGEWGTEAFPVCGCDACDDKPGDVIDRMREVIESAVAGDYEERISRGWLRKGWLSFSGPRTSGTRRLGPGEGRRLGQPGSHKWPPWPRR